MDLSGAASQNSLPSVLVGLSQDDRSSNSLDGLVARGGSWWWRWQIRKQSCVLAFHGPIHILGKSASLFEERLHGRLCRNDSYDLSGFVYDGSTRVSRLNRYGNLQERRLTLWA
jgi:hypothetical protein